MNKPFQDEEEILQGLLRELSPKINVNIENRGMLDSKQYEVNYSVSNKRLISYETLSKVRSAPEFIKEHLVEMTVDLQKQVINDLGLGTYMSAREDAMMGKVRGFLISRGVDAQLVLDLFDEMQNGQYSHKEEGEHA